MYVTTKIASTLRVLYTRGSNRFGKVGCPSVGGRCKVEGEGSGMVCAPSSVEVWG